MAMSNELELGLLRLLALNETDTIIDGIGSGILASATPGSLYLSLHTASVGEAGNQTTSETNYTDYAREALPRQVTAGDDWTVSANVLTNTDDLLFPTADVGTVTQTITDWAIGTDASGTGHVLFYGAFVQAPTVFTALEEDIGLSLEDYFTSYDHGLVSNDKVRVYSVPGASSLPGGISEGTTYYVIFASFDAFQLSATPGPGAPVALSSDGAGWVAKLNPLVVDAGVQPKITAGTLQVQLH